jgi:broad specificity phosphatase PhoE
MKQGVAHIYLVRHGRTALNAAGVLRGLLDPPLDEVGRQEARRLGATLGDGAVRMVVASPLRRTVETAEAIAAPAGLVVTTDERLIDRDYGPWAGQPKEAVETRWGSLDAAPEVEPSEEVRARAMAALDDLARALGGGTAVVVSHDVPIRLILVGLDPGLGDPDDVPQDTGCYNTLRCEDGRWSVLRINEIPDGSPLRSGESASKEGDLGDLS